MTEQLITPLDELTGVPLPILPVDPVHGVSRDVWTDYHHTFFHRADPTFKGDAGRALRLSRGQEIPRWLHTRYHQIFQPPAWPQSREEKFRLCVLGAANMVGPLAIDLTQDDPSVPVPMTPQQYATVTNPQSMHHEYATHPLRARRRRDDIGRFFAAYILDTTVVDSVDDALIAEFLDTKVHARKVELGNLMLRNAIMASVEPLVPTANEALSHILRPEGALSPQSILRRTVRRFFEKRRFIDYYGPLTQRLREAMAVA